MKEQFVGKTVAITGAAGGIGRSLCRFFAREGASIAALDIGNGVDSFVAELTAAGARAAGAIVDITDAEGVAVAFATLAVELGSIDILVNNAGFTKHPTLDKTSPAEWQGDVNGNLNGAYNCIHAVLPGMKAKGGGAIINVGSVNGIHALGDPAYGAAKAGLVSLTKAVAMEYGRFNIRANAVLPGTVRTPIWEERIKKDPKVLETLTRWYPLGRVVDPDEVASVVAFLASDGASAVTGAAIPVDCGLMAGNIVMTRELTLEDL